MGGSGHQGGHRRGRIRAVKKQKLDSVRNDINVTPLVDVCLVLLIIFMVIAPMLSRGKEVPLPKTEHHATAEDDNQPIVAVDRKGQIYVDKSVVPDLETMKQRVTETWNSLDTAERKVYVKADRDVHYGKVYPVVMALHDLGLGAVELGTNERKEKGE